MTYKGRNTLGLAALHELLIALVVGGDENDLSLERVVYIADELHHIWTAATLLRVPEA